MTTVERTWTKVAAPRPIVPREWILALVAMVLVVSAFLFGYVLIHNGVARSATLPPDPLPYTASVRTAPPAVVPPAQAAPQAERAAVPQQPAAVAAAPQSAPQADPQLTTQLAARVAGAAIGSASMALVNSIPLDEADNLRWSLIRRTPAAAEVYNAQSGVNWQAVRSIEIGGEILVPAGFTWSFNETFREGPGYKSASGILAGGHCALATVFNGAAQKAALPTQFKQHRTPFPGYAPNQAVNIFWGRDDLTVRNTLLVDVQFRWQLTADGVTIEVVPLPAGPNPALPAVGNATIALTYGRPRSGKWGTLGQTNTVDHSIYAASIFGDRVNSWNGDKPVVVAINPNVFMAGASELDQLYLYHLIAEAERRGAYVMLDVQTGSKDPMQLFTQLFDRYLRENVWFDWDVEHTTGGKVSAAQITAVAQEYFRRRTEKGYQQKGVFAFYVYDLGAVSGTSSMQKEYENGVIVPIFDGYGPSAAKLNKTNQFVQMFGGEPYGVMEFETRWGTKYDSISAQEYFRNYPNSLIFASQ